MSGSIFLRQQSSSNYSNINAAPNNNSNTNNTKTTPLTISRSTSALFDIISGSNHCNETSLQLSPVSVTPVRVTSADSLFRHLPTEKRSIHARSESSSIFSVIIAKRMSSMNSVHHHSLQQQNSEIPAPTADTPTIIMQSQTGSNDETKPSVVASKGANEEKPLATATDVPQFHCGAPTKSGVRNLQDSSFNLNGAQFDDNKPNKPGIRVTNPPGGRSTGIW